MMALELGPEELEDRGKVFASLLNNICCPQKYRPDLLLSATQIQRKYKGDRSIQALLGLNRRVISHSRHDSSPLLSRTHYSKFQMTTNKPLAVCGTSCSRRDNRSKSCGKCTVEACKAPTAVRTEAENMRLILLSRRRFSSRMRPRGAAKNVRVETPDYMQNVFSPSKTENKATPCSRTVAGTLYHKSFKSFMDLGRAQTFYRNNNRTPSRAAGQHNRSTLQSAKMIQGLDNLIYAQEPEYTSTKA